MPAVFPTLVPVPGSPFTFTDAAFPGVHIIFGVNYNPGGAVVGDPVSARAVFLSRLLGTAQSYGFEDKAINAAPPFSVAFTGSGATINATIARTEGTYLTDLMLVKSAAQVGRYNTTPSGARFLEVAALTYEKTFPPPSVFLPHKWSVTPDVPVAAFGFYVTDVADFAANCLIDLRRPGGALVESMLPIPMNSSSGNLAFWGVVNTAGGTFDRFTFGGNYTTNDSSSVDYFGFDDFILADAGQVIPPAPAPAPSVAGTARPFISRDVKNAPGIQLQPLGNAPPPRRQR